MSGGSRTSTPFQEGGFFGAGCPRASKQLQYQSYRVPLNIDSHAPLLTSAPPRVVRRWLPQWTMDSLKGTVIQFTPHTGQGLTRDLGLCKNMESASKLFKVCLCCELRYGARWGALIVLGAG